MLVLHSLHYMFLSHACTICSCLIASIDHYILMSHASLQCLIAACTKFTCLCGPSPTPDLIGSNNIHRHYKYLYMKGFHYSLHTSL